MLPAFTLQTAPQTDSRGLKDQVESASPRPRDVKTQSIG